MNPKPHRKLRRFIPAGMLAALAGLFILIWQSASEPKYEGRSLHSWFIEYCHTRFGSELNPGLKYFGTNAVPFLVQQSYDFRQDSVLRTNYSALLNRLPRSWGLPRPVSYFEMRTSAAFALLQIRPPASQLLPLLQKFLPATNTYAHQQTLFILGGTGDNAQSVVPYLIAALDDPDTRSPEFALQSLSSIRGAARSARPALLKLLNDPHTGKHLQFEAAIVLSHFGRESAEALPAIKILFDSENDWYNCEELATAALRIDPGQTYALMHLTNLLDNVVVGQYAIYSLGELGATARPAEPALLKMLKGTNAANFSQIAVALKNIGTPRDVILSHAKTQLASADEGIRVYAAATTLEVDPADHDAHLVLMDDIKTNGSCAGLAIYDLNKAGPAAAEAISILREAATHNPNLQIRDGALAALKQIGSSPEAAK
ncbi:MAG TPA: HEAT repeat domain-containing protein [Verrucomicrobiae bacterium]|nr:HEAT repeat domain-containing protein [Verrucomicrobiae bacterium]